MLAVAAALTLACDRGRKEQLEEQARAEAARKAEEGRHEAARAAQLANLLKDFEPQPVTEKARRDFASARARAPKRLRDDIPEVEKCYLEKIDAARKATFEKRFEDVGGPAAECMNAMAALHLRSLQRLVDDLKSDTLPPAHEQEMANRLLDLAKTILDASANLLRLVLAYGPPDARLATFEAIASRHPSGGEAGRWSRTLLQAAYAEETAAALKETMAARMSALKVPLEEPAPATSPGAAPAPTPAS